MGGCGDRRVPEVPRRDAADLELRTVGRRGVRLPRDWKEGRAPPIEVSAIPAMEYPPLGMPPMIGLLGNTVLAHYDIVFDSPKRRVRLYARPLSSADTQPHDGIGWLPPGVMRTDCFPMEIDKQQRVFFPIQVNGHPLHSMFDSGSKTTNINLAAARVLGIDTVGPYVTAHAIRLCGALGRE